MIGNGNYERLSIQPTSHLYWVYTTMKRTKPSSERSSTPQNATQKKTRFVSPEDDPARFAEDVDAQLEQSYGECRGWCGWCKSEEGAGDPRPFDISNQDTL